MILLQANIAFQIEWSHSTKSRGMVPGQSQAVKLYFKPMSISKASRICLSIEKQEMKFLYDHSRWRAQQGPRIWEKINEKCLQGYSVYFPTNTYSVSSGSNVQWNSTLFSWGNTLWSSSSQSRNAPWHSIYILHFLISFCCAYL
jgi:hypothetical protein